MNDLEFEKWVFSQREIVTDYLNNQGITNPNVGEWPAFEVAPYFSIWAIESKKIEGKIDWWAFSGDCQTDYVTERGFCHPREALRDLINNWTRDIPKLKKGHQPPNSKFGNGSNVKELGELLEKRVIILTEWLEDDTLWEDR